MKYYTITWTCDKCYSTMEVRGKKAVCPNCGRVFYDIDKDEAIDYDAETEIEDYDFEFADRSRGGDLTED